MTRLAVLALLASCRFGFDAHHDAQLPPSEAEIAVDAMLAVDAPMLTLDADQCPAGYQRVAASCYRFSGAVQVPTWIDGELACEADGVGAHLVTIQDAIEGNVLTTTFQINDYWCGVTDRVTEGVYRNVTGEVAPYLLWVAGEPTSSDCAQFDAAGKFHVSSCDTSDEYLCEFDGIPAAAGAY